MNGVKGLLHVRRKILVATALNRTTRFFAEPVLSEGPRMTRYVKGFIKAARGKTFW